MVIHTPFKIAMDNGPIIEYLAIKHADFPFRHVKLPEGISKYHIFSVIHLTKSHLILWMVPKKSAPFKGAEKKPEDSGMLTSNNSGFRAATGAP
jgi:hypothetical protein